METLFWESRLNEPTIDFVPATLSVLCDSQFSPENDAEPTTLFS